MTVPSVSVRSSRRTFFTFCHFLSPYSSQDMYTFPSFLKLITSLSVKFNLKGARCFARGPLSLQTP